MEKGKPRAANGQTARIDSRPARKNIRIPIPATSRFKARAVELCLNLGDALHQAARLSVSLVTSTPSLNLIPSMTFGN